MLYTNQKIFSFFVNKVTVTQLKNSNNLNDNN